MTRTQIPFTPLQPWIREITHAVDTYCLTKVATFVRQYELHFHIFSFDLCKDKWKQNINWFFFSSWFISMNLIFINLKKYLSSLLTLLCIHFRCCFLWSICASESESESVNKLPLNFNDALMKLFAVFALYHCAQSASNFKNLDLTFVWCRCVLRQNVL